MSFFAIPLAPEDTVEADTKLASLVGGEKHKMHRTVHVIRAKYRALLISKCVECENDDVCPKNKPLRVLSLLSCLIPEMSLTDRGQTIKDTCIGICTGLEGSRPTSSLAGSGKDGHRTNHERRERERQNGLALVGPQGPQA